jgi:hypothetical protein
LQEQSFDSQQGKNMDVSWISICAKSHLYTGTFYPTFFWKNIYILFLFLLLPWIVSNFT